MLNDHRVALAATKCTSIVRWLSAVVALVLLGLLGACGGGGATPPANAAITAQPTDQTVAEGSSATFSVAASNAKSYQWQRSSPTGWDNIPGAQSASYSTGSSSIAMSGLQYRVVVFGEANQVTSTAASLTVTALVLAPAITVAPSSTMVRSGEAASFFVTATGSNLVYQWQQSRDGVSWVDIPGATLATLTRLAVPISDNGLNLRVLVSNALGVVGSPPVLLIVEPAPIAPAFSKAPTDTAALIGQTATFEVLVLGTPTPSLRWQRSSDNGSTWGDIGGATATTYTTAPLSQADDGLLVRAVANNSAGSATSAGARLRVMTPAAPALLAQPQDLSLTMPANAVFSIQVSGVPTPTLQWQHSSDGGQTWANISGATANSYSLGEVSSLDNGRRLRVLASNLLGSITSRSALLEVNAAPRLLALAGKPTGPGHLDGPALHALFDRPLAVALDSAGTIFVAEAGSHVIRSIDAGSGLVSTVAGRPYDPGDNDGAAGVARLRDPRLLTTDGDGNLYVVEGVTRIRKISGSGLVTTVSYRPPPVFDEYLRGYNIAGITTDSQGNVYFTDQYVVRKMDRQGQLSVLAGLDNSWGNIDGVGSAARFRGLGAIKYNASDGRLYVIDVDLIRSISLAGEVGTITFAGDPAYAGFFRPVNASGDQVATQAENGFIYTARAGGTAFINGDKVLGGTLIAGRPSFNAWRDGSADTAPLVGPTVSGLARDAAGAVYLSTASAVRKLLPDGSLSTYAGNVSVSGTLDGAGSDARFQSPGEMLAIGGKVYVCDGPSVRVIDASRIVSTLARWTLRSVMKDFPTWVGNCTALSIDGVGVLHVATDDGSLIYKIKSDGSMAKLDHTGALDIASAAGIAVDAQGNVFVSDKSRHLIHRISADGNRSVWAGQNSATGAYQDGAALNARFNEPTGLIVDRAGTLYVADTANHVVRRVDAQGAVSTVLGVAAYATVALGDSPRLRSPRRLAIWGQDELLVEATHQVLRAVVPGLACQCAPRALRALSNRR